MLTCFHTRVSLPAFKMENEIFGKLGSFGIELTLTSRYSESFLVKDEHPLRVSVVTPSRQPTPNLRPLHNNNTLWRIRKWIKESQSYHWKVFRPFHIRGHAHRNRMYNRTLTGMPKQHNFISDDWGWFQWGAEGPLIVWAMRKYYSRDIPSSERKEN